MQKIKVALLGITLSSIFLLSGCGGPKHANALETSKTFMEAITKNDLQTIQQLDHSHDTFMTPQGIMTLAKADQIVGRKLADFTFQPIDNSRVNVSFMNGQEKKQWILIFQKENDGYYLSDVTFVFSPNAVSSQVLQAKEDPNQLTREQMLQIGHQIVTEVTQRVPALQDDYDVQKFVQSYFKLPSADQERLIQALNQNRGTYVQSSVQLADENVDASYGNLGFVYTAKATETDVSPDGKSSVAIRKMKIDISKDPSDGRYKIVGQENQKIQ